MEVRWPAPKREHPAAYPSKPQQSGQARLTVRLVTGDRHCLTLRQFGSAENRQEYQRVLAVLEAHGGHYPVKHDGKPGRGVTLNELALAFWKHAERYYRIVDGSPSRELEHFECALRPVLDLYGDTLAAEFGPVALKAVRQHLIGKRRYRVRLSEASDQAERWVPESQMKVDEGQALWGEDWKPVEIIRSRPGLSRKVINQRIEHVKRVFAWAVSEELIPAAVHDALVRVAGLRRGHEGTFDHPKVKPVPDADIEQTLPHLAPQVAAMVRLQRLVNARPPSPAAPAMPSPPS
jgi:hypothetical protein